MRSSIFFEKNFYFSNDYNIIGDFDLFFRLSEKFKFSCLDQPLATYFVHNQNLSIRDLDIEINEFDNWILKNKKAIYSYENNVIQKNCIRKCNYLYNQKKLSFSSMELKKIENFKIRLKFFLKIILQKFNLR